MPFLILILVVAGSRIALHEFGYANNIAPITAIAIFLSSYRPVRETLSVTIAIRFISDLFIGFFQWPLMIAVYTCHLVGILAGRWIGKNRKLHRMIWASMGTAILFFLVTNFALFYSFYPHTLEGIAQSYLNALPFFRGTLIGDVGYTLLLFGGYEVYKVMTAKTSEMAKVDNKPAKT